MPDPISASENFVNGVINIKIGKGIDDLDNLIRDIDRLTESMQRLKAIDNTSFFKKLEDYLVNTTKAIDEFSIESKKLESFSSYASSINKLANGLLILSNKSIDSSKAVKILDSVFKNTSNDSNQLNSKLHTVKDAESQVKSKTVELSSQLKKISSDLLEVGNKTTNLDTKLDSLEKELKESAQAGNIASQSMDKFGDESNNTSKEVQNISNKVNNLDKNLGKVNKTLGYVGHAFRETFTDYFKKAVSSIEQSITETYKAKSEMQSWFDTMNLGQTDITKFNKALDDTVAKYQKVNKYGMGETIASLGVEFNLTEKEMEKALETTAMVTNEYLRAGRSSSEANLAIKDILQGQFQRLSRETGVGESDLEEAGWSGDNTDTMGILEALEKIGKDRNWDVIAQKASSVNDAWTILQNKISVGTSDLIDRYTPALINMFNQFIGVFDYLSGSGGKLLDWFGGDGLEQNIVKWGGLTSAILLGGNALVSYRTGVSATQLAHRGFLDVLSATILGLDGETVAMHGSRNAILSRITGIEASVVADMSSKQAITSKILGLNAETYAQKGLKTAIIEAVAIKKGESVEEALNTFEKQKNTIAITKQTIENEINSTKRMISKGVIAEETAQEKLNSLEKELNAKISEEQAIANAGLTESLFFLGTGEVLVAEETGAVSTAMGVLNGVFLLSPIGWFTLAVLGLASAFYVLTGGLDSSWGKMKQFNETMQNPDSAYQKTSEYLQQVKNDAGESSQAYADAKQSVDEYTQSLQHASYWYNHSKTTFENADVSSRTVTSNILEKNGIDPKKIEEFNKNADMFALGTDKYYHAEQVLNKQYLDEDSNFANALQEQIDTIGYNQDEALKLQGNYYSLAKHSYEANTSEDWWGWLSNSFLAGVDQFWIDWDHFWMNPNWEDGINGLLRWLPLGDDINIGKSITDFFGGIGDYFKDKTLMELIGLDPNVDYVGDFVNWISGGANYHLGEAWKEIGEPIVKGFTEDLPNYVRESLGHWGDVWKGITSWVEEHITSALQSGVEWFTDFLHDPLGTLGIDFGGIDILGTIFDAMFGGMLSPVSASDGSSDHPSFMEDVSAIIGFDIQAWCDSFMSDPLGTLGITLPTLDIGGLIQGLFNIGQGGFDIGGWLSSIFNIDGIVSTFTTNLQTIFTTASSIANNVSNVFSNLKSMIWSHIQGILNNVITTFTNIKTSAVSQINGLKDGIQGGIDKVKSAFVYMKDSILNSAKLIYDGVKSKFDSVKSTIGDFWHNLTNPSSWGSAGSESYQRGSPRPQTARRMFSPVIRSTSQHGAGVNPYQNDSQTVKLKDLMDMVDGDNKVKLSDFLAMFSEGGFGTWDFHDPVKKKVFDTAKNYKTGSPNIHGIGTVGDGYKVGKFWDGKPSFTFDEFMKVAEAIFSAIPYKFYYDSEWKGNWVNALLSGATNCSDGSDALIALANVFGLSGYKQHTTLASGVGHFFAVINGKKMDTTNFQNHGSWSPLGGAGIPVRTTRTNRSAGQVNNKSTEINVTITGDVYGIDDLESKIAEGVKKGLREEFNDPYAVAL